MKVPESVISAIELLSSAQRQQVFDFVTFLSNRREMMVNQQPQALNKGRVFGQYQGRISMSDDFDEPLPESFWLGES